jgi:peptide-methionine (S)-S-oxide reductase
MTQGTTTEVATLGGGCFWCLDAAYQQLKGIQSVVSGYAGGTNANPTYKQVCSGTTGHAEVVQIRYDPSTISYRDLLDVFFTIHDPTTLNRQGADVGTQYRSVIFYHNEAQKAIAEQTIAELSERRIWDDRRRITTRTTTATTACSRIASLWCAPRWRRCVKNTWSG